MKGKILTAHEKVKVGTKVIIFCIQTAFLYTVHA